MVGLNILLIGSEGQVAFELKRSLAPLGSVTVTGRNSHLLLDLEDFDSIKSVIRQLKPQLIVNAAAYTAVDKAEQEKDKAYRINAEAIGVIAEEAKKIQAGIVHYSTDYVFPGDANTPYREEDPVGPLGMYGQSKLEGERAIQAAGVPHFIFRTAWVYGLRGQNFLLTMLRLMQERETLGIVSDQIGAPTWSRMIAETTALAIAKCTQGGRFCPESKSGLYHLTSQGETSWYEFAKTIQGLAIRQGRLKDKVATLNPIPTSAYPTPAKRPAYSVLSCEKLGSELGLTLPEWNRSLELCLDNLQ